MFIVGSFLTMGWQGKSPNRQQATQDNQYFLYPEILLPEITVIENKASL